MTELARHWVVGFDTKTTRIAGCAMDGWNSRPLQSVHEIKASTIAEKCDLARRLVSRLVRNLASDGSAVSVFIEAPLVGRGVKASLQVAKIEGACLAGAQSVAHSDPGIGLIRVYEVGVTEWKKAVVGNGSASKIQVQTWLHKYWNQAWVGACDLSGRVVDEDLADASAICWYGMKTLDIAKHPFPESMQSVRRLRKRGKPFVSSPPGRSQ